MENKTKDCDISETSLEDLMKNIEEAPKKTLTGEDALHSIMRNVQDAILLNCSLNGYAKVEVNGIEVGVVKSQNYSESAFEGEPLFKSVEKSV